MGGSTVEGLIKGNTFRNEDITVSDPSQSVVEKFAKMGVAQQGYRQQAFRNGWARTVPRCSWQYPTSPLPRWHR